LPLKRKIKEDTEKIQELEARIGDLEQQLKKAKSINNKLNKKYKKLQKLHH
jgi:CII-binding regulator of phage lambda lysogenization HflD